MGKLLTRVAVCNEKTTEKVFFECKEGVHQVKAPAGFSYVILTLDDNGGSEQIKIDMKDLSKVVQKQKQEKKQGKDDEGRIILTEEQCCIWKILNKHEDLEIVLEQNDSDNPYNFTYKDITEEMMFGFAPIEKSSLATDRENNGLWAYHGRRKIRFSANGLESVLGYDGVSTKSALYFCKKASENLETPIRMDEVYMEIDDVEKDDKYSCIVYVDTDELGREFVGTDKQMYLFSGYFELKVDVERGSSVETIRYQFPVKINVNNTENTKENPCAVLKDRIVSVDFGTSSSCVAVERENGKTEFMTLSAEGESTGGKNKYENPTVITLYRWREFYEEWKKENDCPPLLRRGDREQDDSGKIVTFDFGYSVKEAMDDVRDDELNATLTELKLIPRKIFKDKKQLTIQPIYQQDTPIIHIVDSSGEEDEIHFDPVAFYAYILGRAINNVAQKEIYTKYTISHPVKFDPDLLENIRKSIEYGLKRALPKPLRDQIEVTMECPEPVAYIGGIFGRYLVSDASEGKSGKMFGVFDLGGGTLDYSFGIVASEMDEDGLDGEDKIYFVGVDGDSYMGGELLIKQISYWLYIEEANLENLTEARIPFEKPFNEVLTDECDENLFKSSSIAQSNVRKLNEKISRKIFEGDFKESGSEKITFMNIDEEEKEIEIHYESARMNDKLKNIFQKKIHEFKTLMEHYFKTNDDLLKEYGIQYDSREVHIFKAGNASKNQILSEVMEEEFEKDKIQLVDETDEQFMAANKRETKPTKIAVTPKTAVAYGQIRMGGLDFDTERIKITKQNAPFAWNVGRIRIGQNKFTPVINRSSRDKSWVLYDKVSNRDTRVYYSEIPVECADDEGVKSSATLKITDENVEKKSYIYIRIVGSAELEYYIGDKGTCPGDDVAINTENIIKLN